MNRRFFLAGAAASLMLPGLALAQAVQNTWYFRVASAAQFAVDLNAMLTANGQPAIMPSGWADGSAQSVEMYDISRLDFDCFEIYCPGATPFTPDDRGQHVNARLTILPGADPAKAATVTAFWAAAISAWFGLGGAQPRCPSLVSFTNTAPTHYPTAGGQVWPATPTATKLIATPIAVPKRQFA